jgi:phosphatidylserine decarboxylase
MAPYARVEVIVILLCGALVTAATAWVASLWAVVPAVITLALLSFYRNPSRQPPNDPCAVLAPADGKIVEISRLVSGPDGERLLRIMIFLSVFDVHVNRSPCAGRVLETRYQPGEFRNALRAEADTRNESNTVVLQPEPPLPGPIRVRQIAGVLARRIVCTAQTGAALAAGQPFGMIKLGSRTEVCLPADAPWEICVRVGQHVKAGHTVLARLRVAAGFITADGLAGAARARAETPV